MRNTLKKYIDYNKEETFNAKYLLAIASFYGKSVAAPKHFHTRSSNTIKNVSSRKFVNRTKTKFIELKIFSAKKCFNSIELPNYKHIITTPYMTTGVISIPVN